MNKPTNLILYIGGGCPYCTKVQKFLQDNQLTVPVVDVWENEEEFEKMKRLAGSTQVPCLQYDNEFMLESDDIIQQFKDWYFND